ncbi:MAG TPA: methyltransferase domain-containing protein [Polyangiaceae bacterium]|nr:methyltransferase domain-containing protein [Polyangiaceae bacterium]
MTTQTAPNDQQSLWNGPAGKAWGESQALMDSILRPFQDLLLDVLPSDARAVLDVGCGTGSTTLAVAERLGASGSTTGIDISEPLLTVARARAAQLGQPIDFVLADAQTHPFGGARFDTVISRFGVMFFENPTHAFGNLRRATLPGGHLRFVAWRSADENPFMTTAERAAAPLLPSLPVRRPDEPGQFAFADRARVDGILTDSGWTQVEIRPIDVTCAMPTSDLIPYVTRFGPVGRLLEESSGDIRARFTERIGAAFAHYTHGSEVRFTAACWLVGARAERVE